MKKVESYVTNVVIFDYQSFEERDNHISEMKLIGYISNIAERNPTRVSYTKFFSENHESL
jgi:hypothetical protein